MSILAVVAVLASGVLTYLWLDTDNELKDTRAELTEQVAKLTSKVEAREDEIAQLSGDLDSAGSELSDLEQERDGIENARQELEEDLDTVATCLNLFFEFLGHLADDNIKKAEAMEDEVDDACREADRVVAQIR